MTDAFAIAVTSNAMIPNSQLSLFIVYLPVLFALLNRLLPLFSIYRFTNCFTISTAQQL